MDRPPRNVWVRPVCLAVIAALLPLDWKRVEVGACNGQPGTVHLKSGWELLAGPPLWLVGVLSVLALFFLWRSLRIEPAWRLFPATLGLVVNTAASCVLFFVITFELFAKPRILWAGWVVLCSALVRYCSPDPSAGKAGVFRSHSDQRREVCWG